MYKKQRRKIHRRNNFSTGSSSLKVKLKNVKLILRDAFELLDRKEKE